MSENIYEGFEDWEDVLIQFHDFGWGTDSQKIKDAFIAQNPEPDQVLLADYYTGNYEGDALVVYRQGDKYFTVEGSHCSCFGLEGQWKPEEYDEKTFSEMVGRKLGGYRQNYDGYGADTKSNWELIKSRIPPHQAEEK